jgi:hypothetical protein
MEIIKHERVEILPVVTVMMTVFRDVTPSSLVDHCQDRGNLLLPSFTPNMEAADFAKTSVMISQTR